DRIAAASRALEENDLVSARLKLDECRWDLRQIEHDFLNKQLIQKGPRLFTTGSFTSALALSRDSKRLFSGTANNTITIWDLDASQELGSWRGHVKTVRCLAMSPDGKRLYSGGDDSTIKAWNLETGEEILTLRGHTETVSSLAVSADGKLLYSGSHDETIKIWS